MCPFGKTQEYKGYIGNIFVEGNKFIIILNDDKFEGNSFESICEEMRNHIDEVTSE